MSRNHFSKIMSSPYFQGDHYKNSDARKLEIKIESFLDKFKFYRKDNTLSKEAKRFRQIRRADCLAFEEFDKKYNINTAHILVKSQDGLDQWAPGIERNDDIYPTSNGYQVCSLKHMDMICEMLLDIPFIEDYKFIDIGSGKGKMLFFNNIEDRPFKSYLGIEIDERLHNIAINNLNNINVKLKKEIVFVNKDLMEYKFDDDPKILFIFRPVNEILYSEFIKKNSENFSNSKTIIISFCPFNYEGLSPESLIGLNLYKQSEQFIQIFVSNKALND